MKQIFVGPIKRAKLFTKINQTVRIPHIVQAIIVTLLIIIPIIGAKKIFQIGGKMSPVAYIVAPTGASGSAILVDNNQLLTAAHVVFGMDEGDICDVEFYDPNNSSAIPIHAKAKLKAIGKYNPKDIISDQDFALLELQYVVANKFATPYAFGNSDNVKVKDKVHAIGFPGTSVGFTSVSSMESKEGEINNISGGWLNNNNFFVASCVVTHGYSGGALEDNNGNLIGITLGCFTDPKNPSYSQYFFLKINVVKKALSAQL